MNLAPLTGLETRVLSALTELQARTPRDARWAFREAIAEQAGLTLAETSAALDAMVDRGWVIFLGLREGDAIYHAQEAPAPPTTEEIAAYDFDSPDDCAAFLSLVSGETAYAIRTRQDIFAFVCRELRETYPKERTEANLVEIRAAIAQAKRTLRHG